MKAAVGFRLTVSLVLTLFLHPVPAWAAHAQIPQLNGPATATAFLLDLSDSMADTWQGKTKIESARQAVMNVLEVIHQENRSAEGRHLVAIASLSANDRLDLPLTSDYAQARQAFRDLVPRADTNIGSGLEDANAVLKGISGAKKAVVLLSDGKTNVGMSFAEILSGPVNEAAEENICIYAVGFGDRSDLDEDLLQRIAQGTCGEYIHAQTPPDLETAYLQIRQASAGTILQAFTGRITQDEVIPPRNIQVPPGQGELHVSLNWPGSRLDLVLTDPQGRVVDAAYPGAMQATYARMTYLMVNDPQEGTWELAVHGTYVPEGTIDFNAIVSARQAESAVPGVQPSATALPPASAPISIIHLAITVITVLVAGGALLAVIAVVGRRQRSVVPWAGVAVSTEAGRWVGLRQGVLYIGRDARCDLVLADPGVSRLHARILRTPYGCLIEDLGSANRTWVNGQPIGRQHLLPHDWIQVGQTWLAYWERGR